MRQFVLVTTMGFLLGSIAGRTGAGQVRFDFETGDLQGWKVVDGSFEVLLSDREKEHHSGRPYTKKGKYFLSTLETKSGRPSDDFMGVVESPAFVLDGPEITLLVGGGKHKETYVALCTADGKEVLQARGNNGQTMNPVHWDVSKWKNQEMFLRMVDARTGGWGHITLDDVVFEGRFAGGADDHRGKLKLTAVKPAERKPSKKPPKKWNGGDQATAASLRAAVEHNQAVFGTRYPGAAKYLERLAAIEKKLVDERTAQAAEAELAALAREALLANPLVCEQPILFIVRQQYRRDHHNTATMFQVGEINTGSFQGGGAMKTFDVRTGKVSTVVEAKAGVVRDPDVHWDARKVVFSMRGDPQEQYSIYEVHADGSGLRRLTGASEPVSDIDPIYTPDDKIIFTSTREPKYCMCNRHIMGNLFKMEADGANIHQIGKSTLHEGHAAVMPDGRILYDRWEYVDRNFGDAQGLWSVNPDGTNHAVVYGNNTPSPGAILDARFIPGTETILCTFVSCHDRPWGAMAIIDPRLGVDGRAPVVRTWPDSAVDLVRDPGTANNAFDSTSGVRPKYEDPWPLSEQYFLVSRMTGESEQMGIFYVDTFGNELLIHAEPPGCYDPMPLAPRPRPPVIPLRRDFENREGYFYIHNVYVGTHMEGIKPGTVKAIRVVESPEKRFWTSPAWMGQGTIAPAMNWHDFNNKRVLGTAPVEQDGSAYFAVPSDRFVFFQLLDEKGMMVQSMRSGVIVQSAERAGCVGCHEERRSSPPPVNTAGLAALRRPPSALKSFYGPPRLFNYLDEVQPVFDKHCVGCHDFDKPGGKKLVLARDKNLVFNASYSELWSKKFVKVVGAGPAEIQQAYSWGSHKSRLVQVLLDGHKHVPNVKLNLSNEELDRVITWVDINAPYYPTYASAYPKNMYGRSPLDGHQIGLLKKFNLPVDGQGNARQISFDRPEMSPALSKLKTNSDAYRQALAIIREGQAELARRPRADMKGFAACDVDQAREKKYLARQAVEMRNRQAIRDGNKIYDEKARPQQKLTAR